MLNKKEFSIYAKELLAICSVVHKNSKDEELLSLVKGADNKDLVESVFGVKDSVLTFIHDGKTVGEMIIFTTEEDGRYLVNLGAFDCRELYVPNMLHFITSDDKDQENRADITKYLGILLKDYSISFVDPISEELVVYHHESDHIKLAENLFMSEISCISIMKEDVNLGSIHFAGEYNDKRDWREGDPYDFLDVYAFSSNACRALLPNRLLAA